MTEVPSWRVGLSERDASQRFLGRAGRELRQLPSALTACRNAARLGLLLYKRFAFRFSHTMP